MARNGSIPVAQKNPLTNEVITCIKETGKEPETCLMETAKRHNLSKKQQQELIDHITSSDEEE